MRQMRFTVLLLITALILGGCNPSEGTIVVDLFVIGASSNQEANIRSALDEWMDEHPGVDVAERERIRNEDFMNLAVMGTDHLPDVFITDCLNGRVLAEEGLVMDISEYAEDVGAFTYDGSVYAFPVMKTYSLIVYDPDLWSQGDPVGFLSDQGYSAAAEYLSLSLADDWGQDWLGHMVEGDMSTGFCDREFVERLSSARDEMRNFISYEEPEQMYEDFSSGSCAAVFVSGDAIYGLMDYVRINNPSLYGRIKFDSDDNGSVLGGCQYGVFINAGLSGEDMDNCIDLAGRISDSGFGGLYEEMGIEFSLTDSSNSRRILTQCFNPAFWGNASDMCFNNPEYYSMSPYELANDLQNCYERDYLLEYYG